MPGRNPVLIASEYVRSTESAQVRKNALTALAVLNDPEAWKVLTDTVLEDTDPEVCGFAERAIASLPAASASMAIQPLLEELKLPQRQVKAYALLGRLRNRGLKFRLPRLSWWTRVRLAKSQIKEAYPRKAFRFWLRTVQGVSLAVIVAALVFAFVCAGSLRTYSDSGSVIGYLLLCLLISTVTSAFSTAFTSPISSQADRFAGIFIDIAAAIGVACGTAALTLLLTSNVPKLSDMGTRDAAWIFASTCLTAVAVRAGTLLALGIPGDIRVRWIMQTLFGGSSGLISFAACLLFARGSGRNLLVECWPYLSPLVYGLAASYASIEGHSSLKMPGWGLLAVPGFLTVAAAVFLCYLPALPLPPAANVLIEMPLNQAINENVAITQVPVRVNLTCRNQFKCEFGLDNPLRARFFSVDHQNIELQATAAYSKSFIVPSSGYIPPGRYSLVIDNSSDETTSIFDQMHYLGALISTDNLSARMNYLHPITPPKLSDLRLSCDVLK